MENTRPNPKTAYIKGSADQLKNVAYKDLSYGEKTKWKLLEPQSEESDVIRVQRSYRKHAQATDYGRRATRIISENEERLLVSVEYKGKFPGEAPRGKGEKNNDAYI